MRLTDIEALPAPQRADALHLWFVQRLDDAGLQHSSVVDVPHAWFVQYGTTYLFRTLWPDRPVDRTDVEFLVPRDAPATTVLLSMTGFSDDARAAVQARDGTKCLLLEYADARRFEASGVDMAAPAVAEDAGPTPPGRLWQRLVQAWRDDRNFKLGVRLTIVFGLAGLALAVLGFDVPFLGHDGDTKVQPTFGPAIFDTSIDVELAPPVDLVDRVELSWTAPDGYNYVVQYWRNGSAKAERDVSRTKPAASIRVLPGSLYCFRVMAISPSGHYNVSGVESIRGASCRYVPSPGAATP